MYTSLKRTVQLLLIKMRNSAFLGFLLLLNGQLHEKQIWLVHLLNFNYNFYCLISNGCQLFEVFLGKIIRNPGKKFAKIVYVLKYHKAQIFLSFMNLNLFSDYISVYYRL